MNNLNDYLSELREYTTPLVLLFDEYGHYIALAWYICIALILLQVFRMLIILLKNKYVASFNMHYSHPNPDGRKILIVGDSSAVGTGASKPEDTLSGLFAKDFPRTEIINNAVNGSLTRDVIKQLEREQGKHYDMIVISTGGNDVWAFSRISKLKRDLDKVLTSAIALSNHKVIVLFFGNEGSAPILPPLVRGLVMKRTEKIKNVFVEVCNNNRVPCIELFASTDDNPFIKDPKKYFAADMLHPSSEGYKAWYRKMWLIMVNHGYMFYEHERSYNPVSEQSETKG